MNSMQSDSASLSAGSTIEQLFPGIDWTAAPRDLAEQKRVLDDTFPDISGALPQIAAPTLFAYCIANCKLHERYIPSKKYVQLILSSRERKTFPLKAHPGAKTKVNLFLRDVYSDARAYFRQAADAFTAVIPHLIRAGWYNDQVTALLVWFVSVHKHSARAAFFGVDTILYGDPGALSDFIKTCGVTAFPLGSMLVELKSLLGRAVALPDLDHDIERRTNVRTFAREAGCHIPTNDLKPFIREVIDNELLAQPIYPTPDEHWHRRWAYTKSGAHQHRIEDIQNTHTDFGMPERPTRRDFAEFTSTNMVGYGTPQTHAGPSLKLEAGKTRIIYATDSVTYFTFDYLVTPVEHLWRNRNVILDPGAVCDSRFYRHMSSYKYKIMLDYDDFNSQHHLDAMAYVAEYAFRFAPPEIVDWAVRSIYNAYVWKDGVPKHVIGTLFSGHRCTTFFNSVLNAAYARYLLSGLYSQIVSYHVGDDVLIATNDYETYAAALQRLNTKLIRANPHKQSHGTVSGEFLRISFDSSGGVGYLARCVSSLVAGSWVSDAPLGSADYAESMLSNAWTLGNRARDPQVGALLTTSMARRLGLHPTLAKRVCTGDVSVNTSPVRGGVGVYDALTIPDALERSEDITYAFHHATDDFLTHEVDSNLLEMLGVDRGRLSSYMLEASKSAHTPMTRTALTAVAGQVVIDDTHPRRIDTRAFGVLNSVFPVTLIKSRLNVSEVAVILSALGYRTNGNVLEIAFGLPALDVAVPPDQALPYAEVKKLQKSIDFPGVLDPPYSVFA